MAHLKLRHPLLLDPASRLRDQPMSKLKGYYRSMLQKCLRTQLIVIPIVASYRIPQFVLVPLLLENHFQCLVEAPGARRVGREAEAMIKAVRKASVPHYPD